MMNNRAYDVPKKHALNYITFHKLFVHFFEKYIKKHKKLILISKKNATFRKKSAPFALYLV